MFTKLGKYRTHSGHIAIIGQLRCQGGNTWYLIGSIQEPDNNVLCIHRWSADGKSLAHPQFSLAEYLDEKEWKNPISIKEELSLC